MNLHLKKLELNIWPTLFALGLMIEQIPFTSRFVQSFYLVIPVSIIYLTINANLFFQLLKNKTTVILTFLLFLSTTAAFISHGDKILHELEPFFRQMASFVFGLTVFCGFLIFFSKNDPLSLVKPTIFFSIPQLAFGLYQFGAGKMFSIYPRVSGTFSEPGHYGDWIIWVLIPAAATIYVKIMALKSRTNKILLFIFLISLALNIIFTQSNLLFFKILILLVLFSQTESFSMRKKIWAVVSCSILVSAASSLPNSYVTSTISSIIIHFDSQDFFNLSLVDRFGPLLFVLKNIFSFKLILGSSFGSDWYLAPFPFPEQIFEILRQIKPSKSIFGAFLPKAVLYFGIITIVYVFSVLKNLRFKNQLLNLYTAGICLSLLFSMGNFSIPFIWLWLALLVSQSKAIISS